MCGIFALPFCPPLQNLKIVKKCHKTTATRIFFDAVLKDVAPNQRLRRTKKVSTNNRTFLF